MAFRYKLQALLRLQRGIEHQEENRLLLCVARIAGLKTGLQAWEEARLQKSSSAWEELEQGMPGVFLQFAAEWDRLACEKERALLQQLQLAEAAHAKQLDIYQAARQKREVLQNLRENKERAYVTEELRRTQLSLDEAHLLRTFCASDRQFLPED